MYNSIRSENKTQAKKIFFKKWLLFCTLLLSTEHVTTGGKFEVWKNAKIFGKKKKNIDTDSSVNFYICWVGL